ncbi:MAG: hypothetical protein WBY47_01180 [Desulfobacterales bacterium]|jgi:hypothetical protein
MERKRLGRGIEDISNIFISARKDNKTPGGFSSKKLRDATCESCVSVIHGFQEAPKCKIFTLENKKYGVRYMERISPSSADYCEFFEPISPKNENPDTVKEPSPDNAKIECRIEESVAVRRIISFPPLPNVQQNILNSLSKHLEENYSITSIDLRKTDEILRPGKIKYIDEEVTICIEDHPVASRLSQERKG